MTRLATRLAIDVNRSCDTADRVFECEMEPGVDVLAAYWRSRGSAVAA